MASSAPTDEDGSKDLGNDRSVSQTLSRGLQVLEVLAEAGTPLTATEIASTLGLSRAVVYRLLRTLAMHKLLSTDTPEGLFGLGFRLLTLSRNIHRDVRESAYPILKRLANQTGATAFLGIVEGDEVVCVVSAEPDDTPIAARRREGTRRPMTGASGAAIRSTYSPRPDDEDIEHIRRTGFAYRERNQQGLASSIAAPVPSASGPSRSCVTALFPIQTGPEVRELAPLVIDAAQQIAKIARI